MVSILAYISTCKKQSGVEIKIIDNQSNPILQICPVTSIQTQDRRRTEPSVPPLGSCWQGICPEGTPTRGGAGAGTMIRNERAHGYTSAPI